MRMCMCLSLYVYVGACLGEYILLNKYADIHIAVLTKKFTFAFASACMCMRQSVCVRTRVFVSLFVCACKCVCMGNWPTHARVCMHSIKNCAFMTGSVVLFCFVNAQICIWGGFS